MNHMTVLLFSLREGKAKGKDKASKGMGKGKEKKEKREKEESNKNGRAVTTILLIRRPFDCCSPHRGRDRTYI